MAFNQARCMETLASATGDNADHAGFIYSFLEAYGFADATIKRLQSGDSRNVASRKNEGHVALKNQLYYMPVRRGESVHEAIEALRDDEDVVRHKTRFQIVTDFKEVTAVDRKTDERIECAFGELPGQYLFFAPMAGLERAGYFNEASADVKAAAKMGRLFDLLREANRFETPDELHALNVFLTRLLFCYFAEDTAIFKKDIFTRLITEASTEDGAGLSDVLADLFRVLNQPETSRPRGLPAHLARFPYVNGGLFAQDLPVPAIRAKTRRMMIECGQLEWSKTNPDIFGSMFQAVVAEESRDALGQHYTSVPNILKVIRPLFLDKLHDALESAKGNRRKLQALLLRLSRIRIFDPAMGSGNFLIIAYKELRRLEIAVFHALNDVSNGNEIFMTGIHLGQFYGIEIDDFAHEIAMLSLWLAEHQMNTLFEKEFGTAKPTLPLRDSGHLVLGNSLRLDWTRFVPRTKTPKSTCAAIRRTAARPIARPSRTPTWTRCFKGSENTAISTTWPRFSGKAHSTSRTAASWRLFLPTRSAKANRSPCSGRRCRNSVSRLHLLIRPLRGRTTRKETPACTWPSSVSARSRATSGFFAKSTMNGGL